MSFTCAICLDMVTNNPPGEVEADVVATKCGHVFHKMCLQVWSVRRESPFMKCPNCAEDIAEAENRRLWLNQDEEAHSLNEKLNEIRIKSKRIDELELENEDLVHSVEEQAMLCDIVRYEYADLETKNKLEMTQLSEILKLEKEQLNHQKTHFSEYIASLEGTIKDLHEEMDGLKKSLQSHQNEKKLLNGLCDESKDEIKNLQSIVSTFLEKKKTQRSIAGHNEQLTPHNGEVVVCNCTSCHCSHPEISEMKTSRIDSPPVGIVYKTHHVPMQPICRRHTMPVITPNVKTCLSFSEGQKFTTATVGSGGCVRPNGIMSDTRNEYFHMMAENTPSNQNSINTNSGNPSPILVPCHAHPIICNGNIENSQSEPNHYKDETENGVDLSMGTAKMMKYEISECKRSWRIESTS